MQKFLALFYFFFICFYGSCVSPLRNSSFRNPPWPKVKAFSLYSFRIYLDPEIKKGWVRKLQVKALLWEEVIEGYFPHFKKQASPLNLVLYEKEDLYFKYEFFRRHPHVRSYFVRSAYSIHIALEAGEKVWLHEFSHALLEKSRPQSPYWFHEGLAKFIEQQGLLRQKRYKAQALKIKVPAHIKRRASKYRFTEFQNLFQKEGGREIKSFRYSDISTLLFYYLWSKGKMISYLLAYQSGEEKAEALLLKHLKEKDISHLLKNFHAWTQELSLKEGITGS